jgi:DMSO/TMAO reductase YedYZ heme-binding membrane subunit
MQTIWLLLAAVCGFLTLKFPFYSGNKIDAGNVKIFEHFNASGSIIILILTVAVLVAALITIFLYKNRKLQLRITLAVIVVSLLNIFLYYTETKKFAEGGYSLTALLTVAIPVFLFFAARNIYKDEKLVKSMDRLR